MLTREQKLEFTEILETLGENLDISETEHNAAISSYQAVGSWLSQEGTILSPYKPQILPQGSFLLGTVIKPTNGKDDIDIDLVCQLTGKNPSWTQAILKQKVKARLGENATYRDMLDKEGRRCWTLKYRQESDRNDKYHMDILPSIIADGYSMILEKAFSNLSDNKFSDIAIRITDNEEKNYYSETNHDFWLKSNPFGYAKWFYNRANIDGLKLFALNESVRPAPKYQSKKLPLQRVIQILKRHRDIKFNGDKEKPISIIITTLAAKVYQKQNNVLEALIQVVNDMHLAIEEKTDYKTGETYKFIGNPVNPEENFADKWRKNKNKQTKFENWLRDIKADLENAFYQSGKYRIQESLAKSFGADEVARTFSNIGNRQKILTEQGKTRFDTKAGIVAGAANIIKPHNFFGNED